MKGLWSLSTDRKWEGNGGKIRWLEGQVAFWTNFDDFMVW